MDEVTFTFGSFQLIPAQRTLSEDGKPLRLGSRAFDILVALVESAGETIAKEELMPGHGPIRSSKRPPLGFMLRRCAKRSAMAAPASATSPTTSGEVMPLSHR